MKLSHILYKANDLHKSVAMFRDRGFDVEYGSMRNPHNALIYFSDGPYIEILQKAPISKFLKAVLKCIGKAKLAARFDLWESAQEGFFEICLETDKDNFDTEIKTLQKYNQKFFVTKSQRLDPRNRRLKWKLLFPMENRLPFMMTYFNTDPKPKNHIHPNGTEKIDVVVFGVEKEFIPIVNALCHDKALTIKAGKGIRHIGFKSNS